MIMYWTTPYANSLPLHLAALPHSTHVCISKTLQDSVLSRFSGPSLPPPQAASVGRRNHPGSNKPCQACLGRWGTFSINEGRTGRCARVVCWDKSTNETTVSKVALGTKGAVLSHDVIPGACVLCLFAIPTRVYELVRLCVSRQ
jgi:hypothetical protein